MDKEILKKKTTTKDFEWPSPSPVLNLTEIKWHDPKKTVHLKIKIKMRLK